MKKETKFLIILFLIIFIFAVINLTTMYENYYSIKNKHITKHDIYEPFQNTNNYKLENKDRYISYHENNKHLSYEDVITYVNIGLDKGFYNYIKNAQLEKENLILVNKFNKLSKDFTPTNLEEIDNKYFINGNQNVRKLTKEAKEAFEKLSNDSIKNNTPVYGQSAYRSYEMQETLYNNAINNYGKEKADLDTARPGHSEHQTALAIDVSSTKYGNMLEFGNTTSFTWMINNAHKYGFILRYTEKKENIHGYIHEPWHFRYVGIKTATDIYNNHSNLTYDEYYYKYIDNK